MRNKVILTGLFILSIVFFVLWALMLPGEDSPRVWRGLLINFLFFTPAAAGLVILPAIVKATYGKWMKNAEVLCWAGLSFSLPSVILLIILWAGSASWAPWMHAPPGKLWWLDNEFLFIRNLVALLLFWSMAFYFYYRRYSSKGRLIGNWLLVVYAFVFSLMGFDFIMALEPEWYSMMMGGYFFMTALYIAVCLWALMAVLYGNVDKDVLHDMGKLMIAFCIFSSYLMFSQLFPIWYNNTPHETVFLIPRMNFVWKWIGYVLLLLVYLGPIAALLPAQSKRNPKILGIIAFLILAGMWMERWWLVSAVFEKHTLTFGWAEILPALALLGLFLTGIFIRKDHMPGNLQPQTHKNEG